MKKFFFISFLLLLFEGCAVSPIGIAPASQQLNDGGGNNKSYQVIKTVEDSDGYLSLFAIIPLGEVEIGETFSEMARKNGGDALINIRYWYRSSFYVVGMYHSLEVKADVIKFNQ